MNAAFSLWAEISAKRAREGPCGGMAAQRWPSWGPSAGFGPWLCPQSVFSVVWAQATGMVSEASVGRVVESVAGVAGAGVLMRVSVCREQRGGLGV